MFEPKKLKKSESLEIRIPHSTKQAFMAQCRADGRSASDTLRAFIDLHLDGEAARPAPRRRHHLIAGAMIAAAVGAVALPSLARPSAQSEFSRLDADGDGRVTFRDLSRFDRDRDGAISFEEYRAASAPPLR